MAVALMSLTLAIPAFGKVEISHHQKPGFLLTLARAYRAAGQPKQSSATGKEGLALLPAATSTTVPSHIRKPLQAELAGW